MGAAAGPVGIGLQMGSQLLGAIGQAKAYKAQARADDANAQQELAQGARQEVSIDEQARTTAGDALVAAGMNGGGVGGGSALDALRQTAINAQLNRLNVRAAAGSKANAYYAQAANARSQASGAIIKGLFGAGASALTGFGGGGGAAAASGSLPSSVGSAMPLPYDQLSSVSVMGLG